MQNLVQMRKALDKNIADGGPGGEAIFVTDDKTIKKMKEKTHESGVSLYDYIISGGVQVITMHELIDQTLKGYINEMAKGQYEMLRTHDKFPTSMQADYAKALFVKGYIGQDPNSVNLGMDLDVITNSKVAKLPINPLDILDGDEIAGSVNISFYGNQMSLSKQEQEKYRDSFPEIYSTYVKLKTYLSSGRKFASTINKALFHTTNRMFEKEMATPETGVTPESLCAKSGTLPLEKFIVDNQNHLDDVVAMAPKGHGQIVQKMVNILFYDYQTKEIEPGILDPDKIGIVGRCESQSYVSNRGKAALYFSPTSRSLSDLENHRDLFLKLASQQMEADARGGDGLLSIISSYEDASPDVIFARSDLSLNELFYEAVSSGDIDKARELLENGADVNALNLRDGFRSLHKASYNGDKKMIGFLLESGANINKKDLLGFTPLQVALTRNDEASVFLIEQGAYFSKNFDEKFTSPLLLAAKNGMAMAIEKMHSLGASVDLSFNYGEDDGSTLLLTASQFGHKNAVIKILELSSNAQNIINKPL